MEIDTRKLAALLVKSTPSPVPRSFSMRIVCLLALAALAAGCSSSPPAEVPVESAKPASLASQSAPAAATAPAAGTGEFKPPPGYKKQVANGNTIYCTKIVVLGSRFPKEDCRTQTELEQMEKQGELMRNEMKQRQSICSGNGGCSSN